NLNSDPSTHTGDTPSSGTNVHDGRAVTNETGRYLGRFASRPRTAQAGPFGQVQYHQFRVIEVES
ncbi:MAG TPA: hypothetical protein VLV83_23815, partial [Acidobacteriota bacterium]|nr:hypothetical protein [Acidobacteriota bacterium]